MSPCWWLTDIQGVYCFGQRLGADRTFLEMETRLHIIKFPLVLRWVPSPQTAINYLVFWIFLSWGDNVYPFLWGPNHKTKYYNAEVHPGEPNGLSGLFTERRWGLLTAAWMSQSSKTWKTSPNMDDGFPIATQMEFPQPIFPADGGYPHASRAE